MSRHGRRARRQTQICHTTTITLNTPSLPLLPNGCLCKDDGQARGISMKRSSPQIRVHHRHNPPFPAPVLAWQVHGQQGR